MSPSPDDAARAVRDLDASLAAYRDALGDDLPFDAPEPAPIPAAKAPIAPVGSAVRSPTRPPAAAPAPPPPPDRSPLQTSLLGDVPSPGVTSPGLRRARSADPGGLEGGEGPAIVRGPCKPANRAEALAAAAAEVRECRLCRLHEGRTQTVFGVGDPCARVCFVGEGPGAEEDRQGEPFVGRAGQLLNKIIAAMGLRRDEVYIANTVKCRPPENRTPQPDEMKACGPYLARQLETITPQVLVALGRPATQTLLGLGPTASMSDLRGRFHRHRGVPVMPTYHPAYLLRNPAAKKTTWDDIRQVMRFLAENPDPLTRHPE